MRGRLLGTVLVVLAICATSLATLPGASAARGSAAVAAAGPCSTFWGSFHLIVIPGAGESGRRGGPTLGRVARSVTREIKRHRVHATVTRQVVTYSPPAPDGRALRQVRRQGLRADYFAGARRAVDLATRIMRHRVETCPRQALVVVGYSQGATVARLALARLRREGADDVLGHLAAAVLVGDPTSRPDDGARRFGTQDGRGILDRATRLPGQLRRGGTLVSWCLPRDLVCHADPEVLRASPARGVRAHQRYSSDALAVPRGRLAGYVDERIGWLRTWVGDSFEMVVGREVRAPLVRPAGAAARYRLVHGSLPPGIAVVDGALQGTPTEPVRLESQLETWNPYIAPAITTPIHLLVHTYEAEVGRPGTVLVSRGLGGEPANGASELGQVSADGRYVAFVSEASNLVPDDTNGRRDVFLFERETGERVLVSTTASGGAADQESRRPRLSDDGRFVVFESAASNLVPQDVDDLGDVFVWDSQSGDTTLVSSGPDGEAAGAPWISADGEEVYFRSQPSASGSPSRLHRWTRTTGVVEAVDSPIPGGTFPHDHRQPWVASEDGRYAVVATDALDTADSTDLHVWDLDSGTEVGTCRLPGGEISLHGSVSSDGAFLLAEWYQHYSRDTLGPYRQLCDVGAGAATPLQGRPDMTPDAALLALAPAADVRARDRLAGTETSAFDGPLGPLGPTMLASGGPGVSVSDDGLTVAYETAAINVLEGDDNRVHDVFLWDRSVSP